MADTPKTLSDVKALLEEAVQVVSDLEASSTPQSGETNANGTPADAPTDSTTADASTDTPEDADDQAVDADKAQLATDEAKDEANDASEPAESDNPTPPTA